jgi:hypothetical protein
MFIRFRYFDKTNLKGQHVLDTLHIINCNREKDAQIDHFIDGTGLWFIVDTEELGRVLYTHTIWCGQFKAGLDLIEHLFEMKHCDHIVTCYPKAHLDIHPDITERLGILYTEYNEPIGYLPDGISDTITNIVGVKEGV